MRLATRATTVDTEHTMGASRTAGRQRRHRPGAHRKARHSTATPLHEALSVGLGCDATGYRLRDQAEWY